MVSSDVVLTLNEGFFSNSLLVRDGGVLLPDQMSYPFDESLKYTRRGLEFPMPPTA